MLIYKPVARYCTDGSDEVWVDLQAYDQAEAVALAPATVHSFQIFEQPLPPEGATDAEAALAVYGEARRVSTTYWLGGYVCDLAQLERIPWFWFYFNYKDWKKMGIIKVIYTRLYTWEPFGDRDIIITGV